MHTDNLVNKHILSLVCGLLAFLVLSLQVSSYTVAVLTMGFADGSGKKTVTCTGSQ